MCEPMDTIKKHFVDTKNTWIPLSLVISLLWWFTYAIWTFSRLTYDVNSIQEKQSQLEANQISVEKVQQVVETALDKKFYERTYILDDRYEQIKKND